MTNSNNRLVALAAAAVLALSMTACSSAPASSSSSDSAPSSSSVPESSSSQVMTAPDREYVKGTTTDGKYANEFWGIQFVSPSEEIILATPEQITELLGYGTEAMGTDPQLAELLKPQLESCELIAVDNATGSSLMLTSLELPMSGISAEIYIKGILEGVKSSGSDVTIELDNEGASFTETVAGKEFTCICYTVKGTEAIPDNHQTQRIIIDGKRALIVSTTYPPGIKSSKAKEAELLAAVTALGMSV